MKKIVISGCSGFIGRNLAKKYLDLGCVVFGIGMETDTPFFESEPNFHFVKANFENYFQLPSLIKERGFDCFIHLAWAGYGKQTNDYEVQIKNIHYTCVAISSAIELGCKKFVFADSSHEYQMNYYSNNKDNDFDFCSIYGTAKLAASRFCRVIAHNNGILFNGVLFTNVYGVGDYSQRSANTFVRKLNNGEDLSLVDGDFLYDWTYIDDVVQGIICVEEQGVDKKVYYVGNNELRSFKSIITECRDVLSPSSKLFFGAYKDTAIIDYSHINVGELSKDTDYVPKWTLEKGVLELSRWLKSIAEGIKGE